LLLGLLFAAASARAGYTPTDQEQYMLEVTNRARLNPDAEVYRLRNQTWGDMGFPQPPDLNEGITSNLLGPETRQPLAFNVKLIQSARDYSQTLLANNAFTHYYGGTDPQSRMGAAGYVFTSSYGWAENLALIYSSAPLSVNAALVENHYEQLFIDGNVSDRGHRRNLMSGPMKEIGIGIASTTSASYTPPGGSGKWYAVISTQDFAFSASSFNGNPLLTGVVYSDTGTVNDFYDPGEGLGGLTVAATPVGGGTASTTTTWTTGGYSLPLVAGTYNVSFSGGGLSSPISYTNMIIGSGNVKLDASSNLGVWNLDGNGAWSSADNWSGALPAGSGVIATFAGKATAPRTVSVTSAETIGTINFNDASAGYTISGSGTLTFQLAGDRSRAFVYAGSHTITTPIILANGLDITTLSATDSLTLSGVISNSGAQSIVKFGKGMLNLSGSNLFNGGLTVTDGTVTIGNNSALGSGILTLGFASDNAALLAGSAVTVSNPIEVATGSGGTCTLGATIASGTAQFGGNVNLDHDLLLDASAGGTVRLSSTISGSGGLTTIGPGVFVLSGNNNYSGLTTVSAGKLILTSARALIDRANVTVGNPAEFGALVVPDVTIANESSPDSPTAATTAVPEPGTAALASTLACGALAGRRLRLVGRKKGNKRRKN
jgi:autotransporter-associated beta strand protein